MSGTDFLNSRDLLHERAMIATGLDDFGDPDYLPAMEVFLQSFDEEAVVTSAEGKEILFGILQQRLQSRLQTIDQLTEHPKVSNAKIVAPVFILGLPRSGTTILQHMLSRDPQFQALQYWLGESPMPRPPREDWAKYPMFGQVQRSIDAVFEICPHWKAMHYMAADEPEECRLILEQTFANASLCVYSHLPDYRSWLLEQDLTPQYEYYADVLKLIGAREPEKTWLLKCPHHSIQIQHLLRVFPDARIVLTHRDPLDIVPSTCSLASAFIALFERENYNAERLGHRFLDDLEDQLECLLNARETHPDNFYDFPFAQFSRDPIGSIERMYDRFGLHYDDDVAQALKQWFDHNPKGTHGDYKYKAEDFGLTPEMIQERFSHYQDYRI